MSNGSILKRFMLRGENPGRNMPGDLTQSYETYDCWDVASNWVIYNIDIAYMPSASYVYASCFNFSVAV